MVFIVFIILMLVNIIAIIALAYIITESVSMLNSYIEVRKVVKIGMKREMVVMLILSILSTLAYSGSYVLILMGLLGLFKL